MDKVQYIAFYGTLMSNHKTPLHESIRDSLEYVEDCLIPGELYDLGRMPALIPGSSPIHAELYKVIDAEILEKLDEYEAVDNLNPDLPGYVRKSVHLIQPKVKAWAYYYDGPITDTPLLPSNRWQP